MPVCRYYLQGTCRFGDRCRNEHVDPDYVDDRSSYSSRRQDYGYQDRYRQQGGYQDRYRQQGGYQNYHQSSYEDPNLSYGPRRKENYERHSQRYDNQNESNANYKQSNRYNSNERYNQRNYSDNHYSNERYTSPERQNNSRYDNINSTRADNRSNKYDRSQYEWVSEDYKRVQKNYRETSTSKSFASTKNFSFKDTDVYEAEDENDEEMLILAEMVKEDMIAWELSNQWPLTCYSPFMKKGGFPGFNDVSFEELRYEALQAKENNTFNTYIENVAKTILDVQHKRNRLKEPTNQLKSFIKKLRKGEPLTADSEIDGEHPTSQIALEDMLAEESSSFIQQNIAPSFSFKSISDQEQSIENKASSFIFKSVFDQSTTAPSSSSFSFKLPFQEKIPVVAISTKVNSVECNIYTVMDQLAAQKREQFSATTFVLGEIPTVPPPKELCF